VGWFRRRKDPAPPPEAAPRPEAAPAPASGTAPAPQPPPGPRGRRAVVVGLGKSGLAACRLLAREGAEVTAVDEGEGPRAAPELPEGVTLRTGPAGPALEGAGLVVVSPGVPMAHPALVAAREAGAEVIAEVELAFRHLKGPLIGITGTNGKSTVTAMVGHVLSGWKERVFTGGNLGDALSNAALAEGSWDFVVAELSSFQLEGTTSLAPVVGALLNTSPDHLDRYPDVAAYYRAKFRLFAHMRSGYALLNARDPSTPLVAEHHLHGANPVLFNLPDDAPAGSDGVRVTDGVVTVTTGGRTLSVLPVAGLPVAGLQNVENAQAAAAVCLLVGCPLGVVGERLKSFTGLPHRMQVVPTDDGLTWIDDSKATNPGAAVKALAGASEPLTVLLGGRDKGCDLFSLREPVFEKARRAIVFGEAAEKFRVVLQGHPGLTVTETLGEAVAEARAGAAPGETVLLSPACASFDAFTDYAARGDAFARLAQGDSA